MPHSVGAIRYMLHMHYNHLEIDIFVLFCYDSSDVLFSNDETHLSSCSLSLVRSLPFNCYPVSVYHSIVTRAQFIIQLSPGLSLSFNCYPVSVYHSSVTHAQFIIQLSPVRSLSYICHPCAVYHNIVTRAQFIIQLSPVRSLSYICHSQTVIDLFTSIM